MAKVMERAMAMVMRRELTGDFESLRSQALNRVHRTEVEEEAAGISFSIRHFSFLIFHLWVT
jgi:hypothetical protein